MRKVKDIKKSIGWWGWGVGSYSLLNVNIRIRIQSAMKNRKKYQVFKKSKRKNGFWSLQELKENFEKHGLFSSSF